MRCKSLIERSEYFTGIRCSRVAKFKVNGVECCTQHKNVIVQRNWFRPPTVESIK